MTLIAPNVSALLGVSVAAKLFSAAGGIKELSVMPPGNIQVLGKSRKALQGLSTAGLGLHFGVI